MRKFDTKVQDLKYNVLKEVARQAFNGTLQENLLKQLRIRLGSSKALLTPSSAEISSAPKLLKR